MAQPSSMFNKDPCLCHGSCVLRVPSVRLQTDRTPARLQTERRSRCRQRPRHTRPTSLSDAGAKEPLRVTGRDGTDTKEDAMSEVTTPSTIIRRPTKEKRKSDHPTPTAKSIQILLTVAGCTSVRRCGSHDQ